MFNMRSAMRNVADNTTNNEVVNNTLENDEPLKKLTLEDMQKNLLKYNFNYKYTVNYNNEKTIYEGIMLVNETKGIKETVNGREEYYLKGKEIYKVVFGENVLVTDKTTSVYNNYLSVDHIMEMIADYEYTKVDNEYNFQIDEIYVKIVTGVDNIIKIEIIESNNSYLLEFSNVNKITALTN